MCLIEEGRWLVSKERSCPPHLQSSDELLALLTRGWRPDSFEGKMMQSCDCLAFEFVVFSHTHTHTHTRKKHRACIYPASRNGRNIPSNAQHEDLSKWHPEVMFNLFFDLCWNVTGLFSSWWYVHRPGRFQNVCEWSGFSRSLDVMAHSS